MKTTIDVNNWHETVPEVIEFREWHRFDQWSRRTGSFLQELAKEVMGRDWREWREVPEDLKCFAKKPTNWGRWHVMSQAESMAAIYGSIRTNGFDESKRPWVSAIRIESGTHRTAVLLAQDLPCPVRTCKVGDPRAL